MTKITKLRDFGDFAVGTIVDANEYRIIRPSRRASGTVTGVHPFAPNVVTISTSGGDTVTIRTGR